MVFFPSYEQAEGRNLVGDGKAYQKILRNCQMPFIKEKSGYYTFDSSQYSAFINSNNEIDLYKNNSSVGFFPFNDVNDDLVTSSWGRDEDSNVGMFLYNRNYYFGTQLTIPFYMTRDGKSINQETNELEDMIFEFSGDDDVWVFIDDTLVLDLGGIHGKITGSINFAENQSYIQALADKNDYHNMNNVDYDVYTNNLFGENLLSEGEHTLKLFYLERGKGESNFLARFNLPDKDDITELSGTKTWKDDNNALGLRPESYTVKLYANDTYLKEATFTEENWSFTGLQKYDYTTGEEVNYTISEDEIILDNGDKYTPTINGTDIVNTLTGTTHIEVRKLWIDNKNINNTRPEFIRVLINRVLGGGS